MKINKRRIILVVLLVILLFLATSIAIYGNLIGSVDKHDVSSYSFVVEDSQPVDVIITNLEEQDLIKSAAAARFYFRFNGTPVFYSGEFKLNKKMSMQEVFHTLSTKPEVASYTMTFLEGQRAIDFSKTISLKTNYTEEAFLEALNDQDLINTLTSKYEVLKDYQFNDEMYYKLEGLLAPNTYNFFANSSIYDIIDVLVAQTNKEYLENIKLFNESALTINEVYTLASIIESEALTSEDRTLVASIFMNRNKQGMSLGSDVTTYYGLQLNMGDQDLSIQQLDEKNGYNTRAIVGFPVGPINNPSLVSVLAALNYKDSDYLYFVSDVNGKIYPSKTQAEHDAIIKQLKEDGLWFTDE
ncbi:MAG: endolytic transglycosylase MltG [Bacilli bacterium]